MALIKCRECGREISSQSTACPGCGAPVTPKKSRAGGCLAAIGCIFAFFVIMAISSQNHSKSSSSSSPSSPGADQNELRKAAERDSRMDRLINQNSSLPPIASPAPDLSLLQITKHTWEKGGFDTVVLWHITFWNKSDKPIGNIRYRTRYIAETGDQVDHGGVDAPLGDYMIRKVIPPHQERTIEINDGFVHREAAKADFQIVSWEFVNPP